MEDIETVEMETTEEVEVANTKQVVKYPVTLAKIAKLEEEYRDIPDDLTIKANYEIVRKRATHLRTLRGEVEKRRKELKADALAYGRLVDSTAKEITERLLAIEEPIATKKKDFDTAAEIAKREIALAEERRVDGIAGKIAGIKATVEYYISKTSTEIQEAMVKLADEIPAAWADEFKEKAEATIIEVSGKLKELYAMKVQQEQAAQLAAEAEAKRKQEEEAARVERERLAEEARLKLAQEQAKLAEERREIEAEKARMAAEKAAAEEAKLREKAEQEEKQRQLDAAAKEELEMLEAAQAEEAKQRQLDEEAKRNPPPPCTPATSQNSTGYTADYRAAGNAMLKIVGNKEITKRLLDMIVNGEIPFISFTGAAQ